MQEGVAKLFLTGAPRFVPLAYSCNKLVLCNISFHKRYLVEFVRKNFTETEVRHVKRFGYDTVNVTPKYKSKIYCHTGS